MTMSSDQVIMSFVFLDLESTGLPSPGNYPRITELAMVAIDREAILQQAMKPRVMNKLIFCAYPMKTVSPGAFFSTGLYNDNLFYQKDFDEGTADMINLFLQRLAPPVCLIAHNGMKFDFPLLLAEYLRVGKKLPEGILCADSLQMFRALDSEQGVMGGVHRPNTSTATAGLATGQVLSCKYEAIEHELHQAEKASPTSVKRKLFSDSDTVENSKRMNQLCEPSTSYAETTVLQAGDDEDAIVITTSDNEAEEVEGYDAVSDSQETIDHYASLPGVDELMDDLEDAEKNNTKDDWDSDQDEIDNDTLLIGTQKLEEETCENDALNEAPVADTPVADRKCQLSLTPTASKPAASFIKSSPPSTALSCHSNNPNSSLSSPGGPVSSKPNDNLQISSFSSSVPKQAPMTPYQKSQAQPKTRFVRYSQTPATPASVKTPQRAMKFAASKSSVNSQSSPACNTANTIFQSSLSDSSYSSVYLTPKTPGNRSDVTMSTPKNSEAYVSHPTMPSESQLPPTPQTGRKSYRLIDLHHRTLGCHPSMSHFAEEDSLALLRICHKRSSESVAWMDINAVLFDTVDALYQDKNKGGLPSNVFPYQL